VCYCAALVAYSINNIYNMYVHVCMCMFVCMYVCIIHSYFISHLHLLFGCILSTLNKDVMMMMMIFISP